MSLITRFVNTASSSGGNGTTNATSGANRAYASLNEANAAETTDLVTAGDSIEIVCSGASADTSVTLLSTGWVTSATNTVTIRPNATDVNTTGVYDTSKYRIEITANYAIAIRFISPCNHHAIQQLQVTTNGTASKGIRTSPASGGRGVVQNCFIRQTSSNLGVDGIQFGVNGTSNSIINNIVYDCTDRGLDGFAYMAAGDISTYNNTVDGCGTGLFFSSGGATIRAFNNLLTNNTTDYNSLSSATTDNNVTSDGSGPDAGHINKAIVYTSASGKDFSTSDADVVGLGTDLSADAAYPFDTDIVGVTRATPWDIGAFQSGGGSGVTVTATLGTINYTSQNTTVSLTGSVDIIPTLGVINYTSQATTVSLTGDIDVVATLGAINYSSQNATVSLTGDIDIVTTLGAINYSSNNTTVSLDGGITVNSTLGTIDYSSQNTTVTLAGSIDVTSTLGTIVYNSNKAIVRLGTGQTINNVTAGFVGDIYTAGFKPDTITVNFK